MPTPFPGMDPYLEQPNLWANVHSRLIVALADYLAPLLRPRYYVSVEERTYLDDSFGVGLTSVPDVGVIGPYSASAVRPQSPTAVAADPIEVELKLTDHIRETYLEILEANPEPDPYIEDERGLVITLIEVLSPWNKRASGGREKYVAKRTEVLHTGTNLVEIDLLRVGDPMTRIQEPPYDYSLFVSPARIRPRAHFYPFNVRQPIPAFTLPLQLDDEEPVVDLNEMLHAIYDRAGYDLRINYGADPVPPFADEDAAWVKKLLNKQ